MKEEVPDQHQKDTKGYVTKNYILMNLTTLKQIPRKKDIAKAYTRKNRRHQ